MVAGATGIDLFLLVIDAGEGARAQTHEHLAILRLLAIERGVVAVTKADAVDEETLELALDEARELVPEAHVVAVSAKTGQGLDELRAVLGRLADDVEHSPPLDATRLFVDRVFTLKGIGTIATGTLWSGSVGEGDELRAQPAGVDVRIRSVQVHDRPVSRAEAGQRVAVAIPGVERGALRRGDALIEPGAYPVSYRLDVALDELEPIDHGARVHVHHGTAELYARVVRAGNGYAQLRLAEPAIAARGDRVVLRARTTLGGGRVLDPAPPRSVARERLELLDRGDPASIVRTVVWEPTTLDQLRARALLDRRQLEAGVGALAHANGWYFAPKWLDRLRDETHTRLAARAATDPLDPGLPLAELLPPQPWASAVLPLLGIERRGAKAYAPGAAPSLGPRAEAAERLEHDLAAAGASGLKVEDKELVRYLEAEGRVVRLGSGFAVGADAYERAKRVLLEECETAGRITLARFRDLLGVSRRSAQLLLERFDADALTRRVGDERVLRRAVMRR
jgi:selenocysteine-specific elongation factor